MLCVDNKKEQTELKATNIISLFQPKKKKKKILFVKKAGRHFGFLKKAGRHQIGAGRRALQKRPRQNTALLFFFQCRVSFFLWGYALIPALWACET